MCSFIKRRSQEEEPNSVVSRVGDKLIVSASIFFSINLFLSQFFFLPLILLDLIGVCFRSWTVSLIYIK